MREPRVQGTRKLVLKEGEANRACQLCQVRSAIEQLEEERFTESERTMSEAEQPGLYQQTAMGHAVQIVQVCTGHREVTFRRSQSPA